MIRILRRTAELAYLLLVLSILVAAQTRQKGATEIQVHVTYEDSSPAGDQLRVDLSNATGIPVAQGFTDSSGRALFQVSSAGGYSVKVSGVSIAESASETLQVDPCSGNCMRTVYVRVKAKPQAAESTGRPASGPVTSAADLRIPQPARKAFEKGMAAWQKRDYHEAADKFEKAVGAYPEYDTAYNNLGVMYAHMGDNDKALAAFRRSVELNDKNADADRNLARMLMRQKDYPHAEELLTKSLRVQPTDATTLTMLAIAEIQDGKPDDALRDAQKVHTMPHDGFAVVHYVAGEALEEKHQYQEAKLEYGTYLRESPNGPEAAQVKNAMERLLNSPAATPEAPTPQTQ